MRGRLWRLGAGGPRPTLSIGGKLALAIVALIAIVSASAYVVLTRRERASLLEAKQRSSHMVLQLLVEAVSAPVVFGDDVGVQETLAFLRNNRDVTHAGVWRVDQGTRRGPELGMLRRAGEQQALRPPEPHARQRSPADRGRAWDRLTIVGDALEATGSVRDKQGKLIALVKLRFSLARERELYEQLALRILQGAAALALGVTGLLLLLVRLFIVVPLSRLTTSARELEAGRRTQLAQGSADEVGQLARAFSSMADAIAARERAIEQRNHDLQLVLDSVGQGFLVIAPSGAITAQHSAIVTRWFGALQPGQLLWDYLRDHDPEQAGWLELVWANIGLPGMPLELCLEQLPKRFTADGRSYEFEYRPLGHDEQLEQMVLVVSDVSDLVARQRAEQEQRELLAVLGHVISDRAGFRAYYEDASRSIRWLAGCPERDSARALREVHTLKGSASLHGLQTVVQACEQLEERAAALGTLPRPECEALGVAWTRIASAAEAYLGESERRLELSRADYAALVSAIDRGEPHAALGERMRRIATEPAAGLLERLAERSRALARQLGKSAVRVDVRVDALRLPAGHMAALSSVLLHLVHNAVDHGLETDAERLRLGKSTPARLELSAEQRADRVVLCVADDGCGIDWGKVRLRAEQRGLPATSRADLVAALFSDGLTTADVAREWSGRGVGLAAVKQLIERMGGRISIESEPQRGTRVELEFAHSALRAA